MVDTPRFSTGLRVVWAIAAKDIADAIRNKTTLTTIFSVLFMMVFYRLLPSFESAGLPPRLALYDAGDSRLVAELERSLEFDLFPATSQEQMEAYVADKDIVMLGLVLPPDFDQRMAMPDPLELAGYTVHWASQSAAHELRIFFEAQLTDIAGRPVHINTTGHTVYTQKDSRGYPLLAALSVVFAITVVGISLVPHIMLEEKRARTMEALLVSPANPGHIVLGKALTGLFYCLTATVVAFAFNLVLVNQWALAILAALLGSLVTVGLGLLLGSAVETMGQLMVWAWLLLIPLLGAPFLSIPRELLPPGLMTALGWVPTVALSRLLRLSFSDTAPLNQWGPELALLVGWAAVTLGAVLWVVRRSDR